MKQLMQSARCPVCGADMDVLYQEVGDDGLSYNFTLSAGCNGCHTFLKEPMAYGVLLQYDGPWDSRPSLVEHAGGHASLFRQNLPLFLKRFEALKPKPSSPSFHTKNTAYLAELDAWLHDLQSKYGCICTPDSRSINPTVIGSSRITMGLRSGKIFFLASSVVHGKPYELEVEAGSYSTKTYQLFSLASKEYVESQLAEYSKSLASLPMPLGERVTRFLCKK